MTGTAPLHVQDLDGNTHLRTRTQWERLDKPRGWTLVQGENTRDDPPKPARKKRRTVTDPESDT